MILILMLVAIFFAPSHVIMPADAEAPAAEKTITFETPTPDVVILVMGSRREEYHIHKNGAIGRNPSHLSVYDPSLIPAEVKEHFRDSYNEAAQKSTYEQAQYYYQVICQPVDQ